MKAGRSQTLWQIWRLHLSISQLYKETFLNIQWVAVCIRLLPWTSYRERPTFFRAVPRLNIQVCLEKPQRFLIEPINV